MEALATHLRQRILDHRSAPSSAPPPRPAFLTYEPAPTFLIPRTRLRGCTHALGSEFRVLHTPPGVDTAAVEHVCVPGVRSLGRSGKLRVSRYYGPGCLVFWSILDVRPEAFARLGGKRSFRDRLALCTANLLTKRYGGQGLPRPFWTGNHSDSIYVLSRESGEARLIASLQSGLVDDIISIRLELNLDVPALEPGHQDDPWARLAAADLKYHPTTSVRKELACQDGLDDPIRLTELIGALGVEFAATLGVEPPEIVGPQEAFGQDWTDIGGGKESEGYADTLALSILDNPIDVVAGLFD
jgi:hypothetical protein